MGWYYQWLWDMIKWDNMIFIIPLNMKIKMTWKWCQWDNFGVLFNGILMDRPSGNLLQLAIEAMAHKNRWFTELKDCDFP
jgi:hypothetical protein